MTARTLRLFLVSLGFGAVMTAGAVGVARADGTLSGPELRFVLDNGATVICPTLDEFPSEGGVLGVLTVILERGFAPDDAADIVNASVATFCPEYRGLLDTVGQRARNRKVIVA